MKRQFENFNSCKRLPPKQWKVFSNGNQKLVNFLRVDAINLNTSEDDQIDYLAEILVEAFLDIKHNEKLKQ
jgi:hypothetical protein